MVSWTYSRVVRGSGVGSEDFVADVNAEDVRRESTTLKAVVDSESLAMMYVCSVAFGVSSLVFQW